MFFLKVFIILEIAGECFIGCRYLFFKINIYFAEEMMMPVGMERSDHFLLLLFLVLPDRCNDLVLIIKGSMVCRSDRYYNLGFFNKALSTRLAVFLSGLYDVHFNRAIRV